MISFHEIEELALKYEAPKETIERDYCLTWLLLGISQLDISRNLIFYGGTALKKIYFLDYRFSYDLDFVLVESSVTDLIAGVLEVTKFLKEEANIEYRVEEHRLWKEGPRHILPVTYDGFSEVAGIKEIELDLLRTNDEEVVYPVKPRKILLEYSDLRGYSSTLKAYGLDGIASDKLAAILETSRPEPRDLYDIWYLLKSDKLDLAAVSRNFEKKCGFKIPIASVRESIRNVRYAKYWEIRLKDQVPNLPNIDVVLNEMDTLLHIFIKLL